MLAIEVEFLMGRALAAQIGDRSRPEWPPHPQRLFSALVAAHAELDLGRSGEAALRWLESLPPPQICADLRPSYRTAPVHWVPVNDEAIKAERNKADFRHPLDRRNRKERFFPAVIPQNPVVVFQWPDTPTDRGEHRDVLAVLVENLTYLGHSASPIRACLKNEPVEATLCPETDGEYMLRVPGPGRLARLQATHDLRLEDETVQPPQGRIQPYGSHIPAARSVFSPDALILAFEGGPKLGLDSTLPLLRHLRNAVLAHLGNSAPAVLTGHDLDGKASVDAHLAFVPLGFVNSRHADGSLKGAALVLPRAMEEATLRTLRQALDALTQLHLGPLGSISIRHVVQSTSELVSLRFESYARASQYWASVTPVVLDRYPKRNGPTAEEIISESCGRIGLPAPAEVRVGSIPAHSGVPRATDFHGDSRQTRNRLRQHVWLRFEQPVRGPVLLGAGRFVGLGVCLPCRLTGEA